MANEIEVAVLAEKVNELAHAAKEAKQEQKTLVGCVNSLNTTMAEMSVNFKHSLETQERLIDGMAKNNVENRERLTKTKEDIKSLEVRAEKVDNNVLWIKRWVAALWATTIAGLGTLIKFIFS